MKKILPSADSQLVTRDDLVALADLGEEEGALMEDEETVIHNLLRLREIPITEVMPPRVVVTALQSFEQPAEPPELLFGAGGDTPENHTGV